MSAMATSRWQRVLQQCARQLEDQWPARPASPKPSVYGLQAGFLYSGQSLDSVPRRLLLDSRLTPLERNAWQVFRLLLDGRGLATPRYQDLQPYLSTVPYGSVASRETIARVLTVLRLTRWLSLVARGRDPTTGRLQGSLYVLHDEPLTPAEAMELDPDYLELVGHCLGHAAKNARIVAQHVLEEAQRDTDIDQRRLPTRLDILGERLVEQASVTSAPDATLHESELGEIAAVRIRATPGSESEPGLEPSIHGSVRIPNAACTVLKERISTVLHVSSGMEKPTLQWPAALQLSPEEQQAAVIALNKLEPGDRQAVLNEAGARCAAGGIRKPTAYLMGLIQRALRGEFHPWAGQAEPSIAVSSGPAAAPPPLPPPPPRSRKPGEPLSPLVQACLDELRQLPTKHPGG
ncbi:STY4528 family pathogenicity island replication protein [Pseudomonas sp. H11T01]|uniref:STY4528 family pathogenicity island replication protein n=1 Tax=Pseudomonas sp. H11T01 TaxID=3402749 RepID=UPI003AC9A3D9